MPKLWDHFNFGRPQNHHNLQDGLFQIASQTCSILVKVNNTNNICYGNNVSNVHYDFTNRDRGADQLKVLIPPAKKRSSFSGYRQRLSTVLENGSFGNAAAPDDEDQWDQGFMLRHDHANGLKRWGTDSWCRPSCIPISVILVLIVLVVLVPLLEHTNTLANETLRKSFSLQCSDKCSVSLVESIPEGLSYPSNYTKYPSTHEAWLKLTGQATRTIEIASFYWSIRENEIYAHNSSKKGEEIFQALYEAGTKRGLQVKIVQSMPTHSNPNTDTEFLEKKKAAEVRSVNFPALLGGGVLHTKLWIIDRTHFYIGSANIDWRSLTQVKELGIVGTDCPCLAKDVAKIFDVYWSLGEEDAKIPSHWPSQLQTYFNKDSPMNVSLNDQQYRTYISSSPHPLSPAGRTDDIDAIVDVMREAEKFIYIAVMDYFPLTLYTAKKNYWPIIDNAIRSAALDNKVQVRMLISYWNHSRPSEDYFLRSLTALTKSEKGVDVRVKRFVVPATADQKKIPFARVNHNKYMVTDKTAYIGTSNWSGDYFIDTAGVAIVMEEAGVTTNATEIGIRQQLQDVFERDWNSFYAIDLKE